MAAALLEAEELQPGCGFGDKGGSGEEAGAGLFGAAAGQLRRQGEKELVDQTGFDKLPEQGGAAFVEQKTDAELGVEKPENALGRDKDVGLAEHAYLRAAELVDLGGFEALAALRSSDDPDRNFRRVEDRVLQIDDAAGGGDYGERRAGLSEDFFAIAAIPIGSGGVDGFGSPSVTGGGRMQGARADDDGVGGGAQQAHDEAVCFIVSADVTAAGAAGDQVADHAIERGNEISEDVGAVWKRLREEQAAAVLMVEIRGQDWAGGGFCDVKECSEAFHLS